VPISTTHLIVLPCVGHDSTEEDSSKKNRWCVSKQSFELIFDRFSMILGFSIISLESEVTVTCVAHQSFFLKKINVFEVFRLFLLLS